MNKRLVLCIALFAPIASVFAHGKHVHGEGRLDVAIDKDTVSLDLELPLEVAVGFERQPRNDKEKAALAAAEKALKEGANIWTLTPAAQCYLESSRVGLPKFDGEHADIQASYLFRCKQPAALKLVETGLFKAFNRLFRIEVQRIGPDGQGASRLTPKKPHLNW